MSPVSVSIADPKDADSGRVVCEKMPGEQDSQGDWLETVAFSIAESWLAEPCRWRSGQRDDKDATTRVGRYLESPRSDELAGELRGSGVVVGREGSGRSQ